MYLKKMDNNPNPYKIKPKNYTWNSNYQTTTYFDVLNVLGSGWFLGAAGFTGDDDSGACYIRMVVDGVQVVTDMTLYSSVEQGGNSISFDVPIRFNTSLQIQTKSNGATIGASLLTRYMLD